jgi:hypothetical protein
VSDLGSWPQAQARALVKALSRQGVTAHTEPDGPLVRVLVRDEDSDQAHAAMAGAMEDIARARFEQPERRVVRTAHGHDEDDDGGRPLVMERFRRIGPALAVLVAAGMIAIMIPGRLRLGIFFLAILVIVWFAVRRDDDDREHGPGDT